MENVNSESILGESSRSSPLHLHPTTCALCQIILSSYNATSAPVESISICDDCRFLLLEDLETTTSLDTYPRRMPASRTRRYGSSESLESLFSEQFSRMITQARQNHSTALEQDNQAVDGDSRLVQRTNSSRTTPSGSRRWNRVFSDTESDGFDAISYSAYGGDSDASVDGQSFLENDNFRHPNNGSDLESDTDIDPMNAGLYQWSSDEDDSDWDEDRSTRERTQANSADFVYLGDSDDYLDARGFENMLERLAESESSRRGAPPASANFVNNMSLVTIDEDHESLSCAVCKDLILAGSVVNRLPCFHLYHPGCILPWLRARNTCPLCRYELPTDDREYEEERKRRSREFGFETRVVNSVVEDEPLQRELVVSADSIPRNRWLYIATPIVSMVGISLMLWFGKPSADRRWPVSRRENSQRRWWSFF